jgi:hypothetical protein
MKKLTYPNVVSTLALAVALGTGGAWAADQINGSQLVDRSVGGRKLKNDTVKAKQVKESTLKDLVHGAGRYRSGHLTGEAGGFPGSGGVVQSTSTPLGEFRMSCGAANADARYKNTTTGPADVFRSFVGNDTGTDFDVVPHNGDVGYAATNATGPEQVDIRVGKGAKLGILRVGLSRVGTHCTFDYEFITSQ